MNYPLKSKPKHEHRSKLLYTLVLFLILSVIGIFFPNVMRSGVYTVSKPVWFASSMVQNSLGFIKDFFSFKNSLISENLSLKNENQSLKLKEMDYNALLVENQNLKNQLGRKVNGPKVLARILSKPPQSPYDTIVVDVGTSQGVASEGRVYLLESIIIGTVRNVTSGTALVELFSNGNRKQQVVSSRTGTPFEIIGNGGGNFKIEVPKDTDIQVGDSLNYPGLPGETVANVYSVDTSSQSSFKTIYLRVPVNVFSSDWILVDKSL